MIQIAGSQLCQWDVGRSVNISDSKATHVHFANQGDSKAVIIEITNGAAKIPDYLLQTGKALNAYAVLDGVTLESRSFAVCKRERPENYVYEDDRRNYIYELITRAEDAVENANRAIQNMNEAAEKLSSVCVTVTDNGEGDYVADLPHDMLLDAHNAGRTVYCQWGNRVLSLLVASKPFCAFGCVHGGNVHSVTITAATVTVTTTPLASGGSGSGEDGITPHIGANGNWFIGETDTGMPSRGEDAPQEAILYTPQALSPEQQAQARQNIGAIEAPETADVGQTIVVKEVDENGKPTAWEAADFPAGGGYEWEKIAELTAEENIFYVTLPIDGNQYKLLRLKAKAQAWVVAEEAVYTKGTMLTGARTCGLVAIGYGQYGKYTPFEVWCFNLRDNQFIPVGMFANGNPVINGSFIAYNQINNESVTINSSISVTAFSSEDYLFTAGSTFELWGVRK